MTRATVSHSPRLPLPDAIAITAISATTATIPPPIYSARARLQLFPTRPTWPTSSGWSGPSSQLRKMNADAQAALSFRPTSYCSSSISSSAYSLPSSFSLLPKPKWLKLAKLRVQPTSTSPSTALRYIPTIVAIPRSLPRFARLSMSCATMPTPA